MPVRPRYKLFPTEGQGLMEIEGFGTEDDPEIEIEMMLANDDDDDARAVRLTKGDAQELVDILQGILGPPRLATAREMGAAMNQAADEGKPWT
jgi:hypothetical protein